MRGKTFFGLGTLAGVGLVALSLGLFLVYVNYLGEGYDGPWDTVVLMLAWASIFAALAVALASTVGGFFRSRRER
jgi:hypothetical protein